MDLIGIVTKKDWKLYRTNGEVFAEKQVESKDPIRTLISCLGRVSSNSEWRSKNGRYPNNYLVILNGFPKEEALKLQKEVDKRRNERIRLEKGDFLGVAAQKIVNLKVALFYGVQPIIQWPLPPFQQSSTQQQVIEEVN